MKKSADAAALNSEKMIQLFKEMNENSNAQLKEALATVQKQAREQLDSMMNQINKNSEDYEKRFQEQNQRANNAMGEMMKAIRDIASRPVTVQQKKSGLLGMGGFLGFL